MNTLEISINHIPQLQRISILICTCVYFYFHIYVYVCKHKAKRIVKQQIAKIHENDTGKQAHYEPITMTIKTAIEVSIDPRSSLSSNCVHICLDKNDNQNSIDAPLTHTHADFRLSLFKFLIQNVATSEVGLIKCHYVVKVLRQMKAHARSLNKNSRASWLKFDVIGNSTTSPKRKSLHWVIIVRLHSWVQVVGSCGQMGFDEMVASIRSNFRRLTFWPQLPHARVNARSPNTDRLTD